MVKETENSEPIIYSIDGDSITSNKKQTSVDDNGKPNGHPTDDMKEITDTKLKSDIKKAAYAIRDIKDRLHAEEILRITGGDISDSTDVLRKIIDSFHKTQDQSFETNKSNSSLSLAKSIDRSGLQCILCKCICRRSSYPRTGGYHCGEIYQTISDVQRYQMDNNRYYHIT